MAIEKPLTPLDEPIDINPPAVGEIEVGLLEPVDSPFTVTDTEDGGAIIDFDPQPEGGASREEALFDDNLAEYMTDTVLNKLGTELTGEFLDDLISRKDWEKAYIKGLDMLGIKMEERTKPWKGAAGVNHPLLAEAVVRFQSQAISELFPAGGPAKGKLVGDEDEMVVKQMTRVIRYMNYCMTERMTECRTETERMLFALPLCGSTFKKLYYDEVKRRECTMFVPAHDLVVAYGCADLEDAERVTHVQTRSDNYVNRMVHNGYYRKIDLSTALPEMSDIERKYNELLGIDAREDKDSGRNLLEMMVTLDLPGFEHMDDESYDGGEDENAMTGIGLPYVITLDRVSGKVLSIYRNWDEGQADYEFVTSQHYVHYQYVPGLGFYGLGLLHLIGGIVKSATSILRQLIDAGTLANLPGGLKTRGLRVKGDETPIAPGEFRDVDVPMGSIKDNIAFLPNKEPSAVLYQLLQDLTDQGRSFASVGEIKSADMHAETPVGTTLAVMERDMKILTAIQARMHFSAKKEMKLLHDIIAMYGPEQYPYAVEEGVSLKQDFDGRIDVIPVTNPNSATMGMRILQGQAALQLAQTAPEAYDIPALHRQMLTHMGVQDIDIILPGDDQAEPMDPVGEHMALINQKPVRAFLYQDQEAHLRAHMAAMSDPKLTETLGQSPAAPAIQAAFAAHVAEHLAFQYRVEIERELGVQLPPPGEPLPEEIEVRLSGLVAQAAEKLTERNKAEAEQKRIEEELEDPIIQMEKQEQDREDAVAKDKMKTDAEKLANDMQKHRDNMAQKELDRKAGLKKAGLAAGVTVSTSIAGDKQAQKDRASRDKQAGIKAGVEIGKSVHQQHEKGKEKK